MFVVVVHFNKIISLSHTHICMRTHTQAINKLFCFVAYSFISWHIKWTGSKKLSNSNNNIKKRNSHSSHLRAPTRAITSRKVTVILYISDIQNQPCTQDSIFTHSIQPVKKKNQPLQHVDTLYDAELTDLILYQSQSLQYQTHCS